MTQREKNLAIMVAALLVAVGAWWAWGKFQAEVASRSTAVMDAQVELETALAREQQVRRAVLEDLVSYQARSLPEDPQTAQLEYRAWLIDQLEAAGLDFDDVTLTENRPGGDGYTSLGYSAKAEGDLKSVTRFLYGFYNSPLLHKLTLVKLTPRDGGKVQLNVNVRALAVQGADRVAGVPEGESGRPLLADADAYVASIDGRNFFRRYIPPPPPRPPRPPRPVVKRDPPPPPPKFDDSAHAYVEGLVGVGDRWQAWVRVRTTGKQLRLFAGDTLDVGLLKGTVESVDGKQLVLKVGEDRFATPLGKPLRDGKKL